MSGGQNLVDQCRGAVVAVFSVHAVRASQAAHPVAHHVIGRDFVFVEVAVGVDVQAAADRRSTAWAQGVAYGDRRAVEQTHGGGSAVLAGLPLRSRQTLQPVAKHGGRG